MTDKGTFYSRSYKIERWKVNMVECKSSNDLLHMDDAAPESCNDSFIEASPVKIEPISTLIKNMRERKHLSQETLAQKCGITNVQLSRIEQGKCRPSIRTLCRLAPFLGYSLEDLLLVSSYSGTSTSSAPTYINLEGKKFDLTNAAERMYYTDGELLLLLKEFMENYDTENAEILKIILTCTLESKKDTTFKNKTLSSALSEMFKILKDFIFSFNRIHETVSNEGI